jgi:hypothetical protein
MSTTNALTPTLSGGLIPFDDAELPPNYSWGVVGGPMFMTQACEASTHREQRVIGWRNPLRKYNLQYSVQSDVQLAALDTFFRARGGRARAFRFFDWMDCQITNQILSPDGTVGNFPAPGVYSNIPIYKYYTFFDGAGNEHTSLFKRRIKKPIGMTTVANPNASPPVVSVLGGGPVLGVDTTLTTSITQTAIATTFGLGSMTGIYTGQMLTVDVGSSQEEIFVTSISGGTPTATFANLHGAGAPVTAGAFTIDTVNGYFNNLVVPSPVPTLTFSLEFDTPVMFDKDSMPKRLDAWQSSSWPLGVTEIRL